MEMTAITVKDGSKYFYTTTSYNTTNPLGIIKATLIEYALYDALNNQIPVAKLYKTSEGNWYDMPAENAFNTSLSTNLKIAIDEMEKIQTPTEVRS